MDDWSATGQACLRAAAEILELAQRVGGAMPAILVADRDGTRVVCCAPMRVAHQVGVTLVAGLSATAAALAVDSWQAEVPVDAGTDGLDLEDLALNHGWLESGLIRECVTVVAGDTTGVREMRSRFYVSRPDKTVQWLEGEEVRPGGDITGVGARWMRAAFDKQTFAASSVRAGRPPMDADTRAAVDAALIGYLADTYGVEVLLTHV